MNKDKLYKSVENYLINNFNKLKINSKEITKGDVFLALKGSTTHGNNYIKEAINNGALFIITDQFQPDVEDENKILVISDTILFLLSIGNKKNLPKSKCNILKSGNVCLNWTPSMKK